MLLRHSVIYLVARGVPGFLGLAAIMIFTRMLSSESYGQYSLVVTAAVIVNAICYQWITAALNRFLPQYQNSETDLLPAVFFVFIIVSIFVGVVGVGAVFLVWDNESLRVLVILGVALTWAQALFTISIELARSRLSPILYGIISSLKSVVFLIVSVALIFFGYEAYGALVGLVVGLLLSSMWAMKREKVFIRKAKVKKEVVKSILVYGLPLTASFAFTSVVSSSDKMMLAWLDSESATGLYAAGQGLIQQTISILMMLVHLAAYPLIVRALEHGGVDAARSQLKKNANLLLGVGLPITVMFFMLADEVSQVFLGGEFQGAAVKLIPWFALATLLAGLRSYHFDIAFYLGKCTRMHVLVMGVSALLNILLNFIFIPKYGLLGAVYATVVVHSIAVVLSAGLGSRVFSMPNVMDDALKLIASSMVMAVVLYFVPNGGFFMLVLSVSSSVVVYVLCVFLLDPCNIRSVLKHMWWKYSSV